MRKVILCNAIEAVLVKKTIHVSQLSTWSLIPKTL